MSKTPEAGAELVDLLAEKDEMIQALTGRLEEIAEKYDRLQRSGQGRSTAGGKSSGAGGVDEIHGKLDDLLQLFPDNHPGDQLQRIEEQVESILGLLESGQLAVASGRSGNGATSESREKKSKSAEPAKKESAPAGDGKPDFWEAAKARLMGGAAEGEASASVGTESKPQSTDSAQGAGGRDSAAPSDSQAEVSVLDEVSPPKPLENENTASKEELIAAIDERDRFIAYVISRVRVAEQQSHPRDWNDLAENSPEELHTALMKAKSAMEKHLRESEVANSLERASLARERSKLAQIKQQLEKHILSMSKAQQLTEAKPAEVKEDSEKLANSRWFRMFGNPKSDKE
ncbi:MAG: hypothetical protein KDA88_05465 [Planctomycetaceae bacterium]|nr:hypothetical protein [Planctomycetaceae bacterium]